MTRFANAGIQMPVSIEFSNIDAMGQRPGRLMHRFPFVRRVVFSELCAFGRWYEGIALLRVTLTLFRPGF